MRLRILLGLLTVLGVFAAPIVYTVYLIEKLFGGGK